MSSAAFARLERSVTGVLVPVAATGLGLALFIAREEYGQSAIMLGGWAAAAAVSIIATRRWIAAAPVAAGVAGTLAYAWASREWPAWSLAVVYAAMAMAAAALLTRGATTGGRNEHGRQRVVDGAGRTRVHRRDWHRQLAGRPTFPVAACRTAGSRDDRRVGGDGGHPRRVRRPAPGPGRPCLPPPTVHARSCHVRHARCCSWGPMRSSPTSSLTAAQPHRPRGDGRDSPRPLPRPAPAAGSGQALAAEGLTWRG